MSCYCTLNLFFLGNELTNGVLVSTFRAISRDILQENNPVVGFGNFSVLCSNFIFPGLLKLDYF